MTKRWTDKNAKGSLAFASIHAVYNCVQDRDAKSLVWPDDGSFLDASTFIAVKSTPPLLLDMRTASAIIAVYEALNVENKNKLARMIKTSRIQFFKVADLCVRNTR